MSDMSVKDLLTQVNATLEKASGEFSQKAEKAFAEAKKAGDMSAETKESVDKMATEVNTLRQTSDALKAQLGEVEQLVAGKNHLGDAAAALSLGATVAKSDKLAAFAKDIVQANQKGRVSIPVQAALLSTGVPAGTVEPMRLPGVQESLKQRLFIRDLISPGRTESSAIFWVQQTGFTNAAKVVAEGTAKPYSEIEFANKLTPVTTIAHMFKASKQILDDFAQLQSLIDKEMRYGLKYVEEQEILFGDGTGAHLHGIIPQATAYDAAGIPAGATAIDTMRWAMLQAQLARVPASGHVLHFMDWAKIELLKDDLGRYIIGNPQGTAAPSMWGLPVVETEIAAFLGKFLTGAFRDGAQLFDREDANVVVSTENADDFEKNLISIRCEERAALAVYRPEAFIFGSLPVAAP
ncbi:HK97 family phage major capsid protein [Comamonas odontotermitis]|uniref:HK97 family phage major capsid protein n=1 Tax=Comamonas odontotermitis TaxID=379895 RepID=A0ABR6RFR2_9BURK|nr:phage major capsid protein [Comamonas odontotermitis]MBB6578002.1 HK97 family phage major capsid protein [Comamonas odontotermitis]